MLRSSLSRRPARSAAALPTAHPHLRRLSPDLAQQLTQQLLILLQQQAAGHDSGACACLVGNSMACAAAGKRARRQPACGSLCHAALLPPLTSTCCSKVLALQAASPLPPNVQAGCLPEACCRCQPPRDAGDLNAAAPAGPPPGGRALMATDLLEEQHLQQRGQGAMRSGCTAGASCGRWKAVSQWRRCRPVGRRRPGPQRARTSSAASRSS